MMHDGLNISSLQIDLYPKHRRAFLTSRIERSVLQVNALPWQGARVASFVTGLF